MTFSRATSERTTANSRVLKKISSRSTHTCACVCYRKHKAKERDWGKRKILPVVFVRLMLSYLLLLFWIRFVTKFFESKISVRKIHIQLWDFTAQNKERILLQRCQLLRITRSNYGKLQKISVFCVLRKTQFFLRGFFKNVVIRNVAKKN